MHSVDKGNKEANKNNGKAIPVPIATRLHFGNTRNSSILSNIHIFRYHV